MRVNVRLLKSGEADTITLTMRVHTSPSAVGGAGTTWANVTQPATTNNDAQGIWWLKRLTATTLRSGMAGSSITGTLAALPVTVTTGSNMDAVQYYMQFNITISGGGGETATLADLQVVWIPAYS